MSDETFPDRSMPFRDKIEWMVDSQGWAVVPVAPRLDLQPPFPGYTYTVGLETAFGFPELVVFGLKPADSRGLLGIVVDLLRDGVAVPIGPLFVGLLDHDLRSALLPVAVDEWAPLFEAATDWYGATPFRVVQLAYPDPDGWMPWEPGFDAHRSLSQPVIGSLDGLDDDPTEGDSPMIEQLTGLPDGVVGFEAVGTVQGSDYVDVMAPAVAAAAADGAVRLVYVLGDRFDGYSAGAAWEDTKFGFEHLKSFKRTALVTDVGWVTHVAAMFGWMVPGEFKHFPLAERDAAVAWAAD